MILDRPIDTQRITQMSEEEKIELAKAAYREFIDLVHHVGQEQRDILDKALAQIEEEKIQSIRQKLMQ